MQLERRLSPETVSAYLSDVKLYFRHIVNDDNRELVAADLSLPNLRQFIRSLIELGFASSSLSRYISTLKCYCAFLADEKFLPDNILFTCCVLKTMFRQALFRQALFRQAQHDKKINITKSCQPEPVEGPSKARRRRLPEGILESK